ncbi:PREDICTED: periodic tryptophan protein 2 homolog [Papilio polytes]|uniref:periodic tryptophan protein 2 homolog n=1 Tax=Papilio polytes TaxID=76194 RepID=UPI000675F44D|nr:PREDICTED: periodic tryptophan protein 2 homolog [Papilio polytes]
MKYNYKFQNLLGTVYKKGDVVFSRDGNSVISPVGNRITVYNLKQNKNITLPVESHYNYTAIDVSPNGSVLLAINEKGEAQMISLVTCSVIHKYKFKQEVNAVKFSPDGKYFAACCADTVFIMTAPTSYTGEFRSFVMKRVYQKAYDDVTCLDWSSCSKLLAAGSKDTTTKIYTVDYLDNINMFSLSGHTDKVVGVFFEKKSLDLITVSRNGQVCLWEASIDPDDLIVSEVQIPHRKRRKFQKAEDSEDDIDEKNVIEKDKEYQSDDDKSEKDDIKVKEENRLVFRKLGRHYIGDAIRSADCKVKLTAAQYHKATKMLITGFSNGVFFLHELPDVNLVHSLSVSQHRIGSAAVVSSGEQYVLKQQGHSQDMTCVAYSPDGQYLVTGGYDGKVKLWNTSTGFCFVTFTDHSSTVTSIVFSANKKFFVSSSLDGTVRCYDLTRYRNFRTLTSPSLAQFACAALDASVRLWNCIETSTDSELIQLTSDALQVAYRPDGEEIAVSTLDGNITFFSSGGEQSGSIEGRADLGAGRGDTDLVTAKQQLKSKAFTTICYSADGGSVLCGGNSKHVCLYSVREAVLLKKFVITQNRSLDAISFLTSSEQYSNVISRPFRLETSSTPAAVKNLLEEGEWGRALLAALQLSEHSLIQQCVEATPHTDIELTVRDLEDEYRHRLASSVARLLEDSRHLEQLLVWARALLAPARLPQTALLALEKVLTAKYSQLSKICDFNKYTIRCIKSVAEIAPKQEDVDMDTDNESSGRGTFSDTD